MNSPLRGLKRMIRRGRAEADRKPAITVGLLIILCLALLVPVRRFVASSRAEAISRAQALRGEIEFRRLLLGAKDRFEANAAQLEKNWRFFQSKFYQEDSVERAFASVQKSLEEIAAVRTVAMKSYKFEEARRVEGFTTLPISLEFTANYDRLVVLLNGIESYAKYLRISDCELTVLSNGEELLVRLTVCGFRHEETEKAQ